MTSLPSGGPWRGIIPPLVTPLVDYDTLDITALARLIEHVLAGGVSGIFILGTTGEGPSLSYRLREEMIRETCRLVNGRVPVLACVTDTAYVESTRLARIAQEAGASAIVIAPPYYFYESQQDLVRHLERLTNDVALPVFLYNMPRLTKVAFDVPTVKIAARNRKIAGIKDSSGDLKYLAEVIDAVRDRPDFAVFIGPEEMLVQGMRLGCSGGVTGGANLKPRLFVGMYQACIAGDWDEAERLQQQSREMAKALYTIGDSSSSYLRGLKSALAAAGLCNSTLAIPFAPFEEDEQKLLKQRVATLGAA
jgi:dihydrodipicolinate synthase/N-acetylneuraminate lyase